MEEQLEFCCESPDEEEQIKTYINELRKQKAEIIKKEIILNSIRHSLEDNKRRNR